MAFVLIALDAIETLTLYDAEETDCGAAEKRDDAGNWHCEYHGAGAAGEVVVSTYQAADYEAALNFLRVKRDAFLPGGFIVAYADFPVDPVPEIPADHMAPAQVPAE